ncbi:DUF3328 domain protein [Metarhizium robertsii]|uniref:DUF3328 domain protein n=1 Tax=Metarhizium robertsii TaxID=568076 RepID=A0A014NCC3_9HYPO|nr:DUF3328 domain protein [Metarhizium robertsii]
MRSLIFLATSCKDSLTMHPQSSTCLEVDECDIDTEHLLSNEKKREKYQRQQKRNSALLVGNVFVLLLNMGLFLTASIRKAVHVTECTQSVRLPHSDWIADGIEWEVRTYDDKFGNHGPFRGEPRPELDEAWATFLFTDYTIRVPVPGWRNASSPNTILTEFEDETGGIMGTFSFLHNLHCLKIIRQYMLSDYYSATAEMFKPGPGQPIRTHIDHCIDILRQSELCHADTSLMIFEWQEHARIPINLHGAKHICANPDKLNRWLEAHTVPPFGSILKHPWTGIQPPLLLFSFSFSLRRS